MQSFSSRYIYYDDKHYTRGTISEYWKKNLFYNSRWIISLSLQCIHLYSFCSNSVLSLSLYYYYHYIISLRVFADGFLLEFEWQQVSLRLQDTSQYSGHYCYYHYYYYCYYLKYGCVFLKKEIKRGDKKRKGYNWHHFKDRRLQNIIGSNLMALRYRI